MRGDKLGSPHESAPPLIRFPQVFILGSFLSGFLRTLSVADGNIGRSLITIVLRRIHGLTATYMKCHDVFAAPHAAIGS